VKYLVILPLAVVMIVLLLRRYSLTRRPSSLTLALFWLLLGATVLTGQRWLLVPAAVALGAGFYQRMALAREATARPREKEAEMKRRPAERAAGLEAKPPSAEDPAKRTALRVPKARPIGGFTPVKAEVNEELVYPTAEGLDLVLAPGPVEMSFRIRPMLDRKDSREFSVMRFRWQIADSGGTLWQTDLLWLGEMLNNPWHRPTSMARQFEFVPWSAAPQEWLDAMDRHCILAEEVELIDTREVVHPVIGGSQREIFTKYQGSIADAAWIPQTNRIVVRIRGLFHSFRVEGEPYPEREELEPFGFEMLCEEFMPSHTPEYYFVEWEEWLAVWEDEKEKKPFVFTRRNESTKPQLRVTTRPR
jgi:hypothetical protein